MNKVYAIFFCHDRVVEITVGVKWSIVCISHQKLDDEVNEKVQAQGKGCLLNFCLHLITGISGCTIFLVTSSHNCRDHIKYC